MNLQNSHINLCTRVKSYLGRAGGWAIDLLLNRANREHGHIYIAISRHDQISFKPYLMNRKFLYLASGECKFQWSMLTK